ncbi:MAG: ribonuclease Y [Calditrichaeota bacterium]|nr:ribonuclease Y [Calditrichota bacterium]
MRAKTGSAKKAAEEILEEANRNAKAIEKTAHVRAREKHQEERSMMQQTLKKREQEISSNEEKLRSREKELRRLENSIRDREGNIRRNFQRLQDAESSLNDKQQKIEEVIDQQIEELEKISGINRDEAKARLINTLTERARSEAAQTLIDLRKEAQDKARAEAKDILATAIEKMATDYTMESTLVSVSLPNEGLKGLIIGRGGQNIKAFESVTGVKVIVDDTPETVVMSGFDPIKREIARLAMEALIKKKNISPKYIEQEVSKATKMVEESIKKAAESTLTELKLNNVHPDMKNYLGRLKYRTSYGQNILQHSKEVAFLAGNMAAELGLDVQLARRAGLFHDIGKAVSNDVEGSHVTIGVDITTKYNEHPVVINSVLAHHEEAEPISPVSVLVTAADRISGARPGARRESLEAYAQRISKLEEVAKSFEGVAKTYALSAGREVRVIVQPEKLTDLEAQMLAHDIAQKIKEEMEYPGQIKVTVIRRLIATGATEDSNNNPKKNPSGGGGGGGNRHGRNKKNKARISHN